MPAHDVCTCRSHNNCWNKLISCLRKGVPHPQCYPKVCWDYGLPCCGSSHPTSCPSGSSIQNPWQQAVPINTFSIGRILRSSEISHIWPLGKAESDLVCQILYSHEKWRSHFALLTANQSWMLSQVKRNVQNAIVLPWQQMYPKVTRRSGLEKRKRAGDTCAYLPTETAENFNFRPLISPDTKIVASVKS